MTINPHIKKKKEKELTIIMSTQLLLCSLFIFNSYIHVIKYISYCKKKSRVGEKTEKNKCTFKEMN